MESHSRPAILNALPYARCGTRVCCLPEVGSVRFTFPATLFHRASIIDGDELRSVRQWESAGQIDYVLRHSKFGFRLKRTPKAASAITLTLCDLNRVGSPQDRRRDDAA